MKKILTTMAVTVLTISCFGQGAVNFVNNSFTKVSTNATINYLGQATGSGTSGFTTGSTAAPAGYIYALLAQNWDGTSAFASATFANIAAGGGWIYTGVTGTNALATGSINGTANALTTAGMPVGAGQINQYVVVGWSSNLGTTWSQISAAIIGSSLAANGFIGISVVGGNAASSSPPETIFGTTTGTSINNGFGLYSTNVAPEPATIALAGLGGLSLLALRRKK